jgi:hypothetical protein
VWHGLCVEVIDERLLGSDAAVIGEDASPRRMRQCDKNVRCWKESVSVVVWLSVVVDSLLRLRRSTCVGPGGLQACDALEVLQMSRAVCSSRGISW